MEYYYHINLDERGEFSADVRDETDKTVFEIHGFEIFEDGFMRNKEDIIMLHEHLISLGIVQQTDNLVFVG